MTLCKLTRTLTLREIYKLICSMVYDKNLKDECPICSCQIMYLLFKQGRHQGVEKSMIKISVLTDISVLVFYRYIGYIVRYFTNISIDFTHFMFILDIQMDILIGKSEYKIHHHILDILIPGKWENTIGGIIINVETINIEAKEQISSKVFCVKNQFSNKIIDSFFLYIIIQFLYLSLITSFFNYKYKCGFLFIVNENQYDLKYFSLFLIWY